VAYKIQTGALDATSDVPVLDGMEQEGKEIEERRLTRLASSAANDVHIPVTIPALLSMRRSTFPIIFERGDSVAKFYKPHIVGTVEMILYPSAKDAVPDVWVLWPNKLNALPCSAKDLYIVHTNPLTKR
jgi:hypothetical protein